MMKDKKIIKWITIAITTVLVMCTVISEQNETRNRPKVETINPVITVERWLEIPAVALHDNDQGKKFVFIVDKIEGIWENEYQVHKNIVEVERKNLDTCIVSGISSGSNANVVIKSSGDLTDGQVVSLLEE